jgi:hypothetical protein
MVAIINLYRLVNLTTNISNYLNSKIVINKIKFVVGARS